MTTDDDDSVFLTNANDPDVIVAEEDAAFARGAEAHERIQRSFLDWLAIGEALLALQRRAIRESGSSNGPYGPRYKERYSELKADHPWASSYDPTTISHAIALYKDATKITIWRQTELDDKQRREWTTPKILLRHYNAWLKRDEFTLPKKKVVSRTTHDEQLTDYQNTITQRETEIKQLRKDAADAKAFALDDLTDDQIVGALANQPDRIHGLIKKLQAALPKSKPVAKAKKALTQATEA